MVIFHCYVSSPEGIHPYPSYIIQAFSVSHFQPDLQVEVHPFDAAKSVRFSRDQLVIPDAKRCGHRTRLVEITAICYTYQYKTQWMEEILQSAPVDRWLIPL